MFEQPYVRVLAERLNACLERANAGPREARKRLEPTGL
jgi:hypothetical protein